MSIEVPRIMVINLDRDHARREWMENQFKELNLPFRRVSALTPETLPPELAARFRAQELRKMRPGDVGCFASHLFVLDLIARHGQEGWYIVCEDDLQLDPTFASILECKDWTDQFDILRLNGIPKSPTFSVGTSAHWKIVRYMRVPNGTGSYAITRAGAQKILDTAWDLDLPVDVFFRSTAVNHLRTGGTLPPPVVQDAFGVSSTDPQKLRQTLPKQKYLARGLSNWNRFYSILERIREMGAVRTVKYLQYLLLMRSRSVKQDPEGQFSIDW